jgi:2-polyprenyl-3-methyl-5-hydroxy-6-metoxy-1,4-benzoquinol methylase
MPLYQEQQLIEEKNITNIEFEKNWFDGTEKSWWFKDWNPTRVKKLVSIFGEEWFKDKTILDMACGFGNISRQLQQYNPKQIVMTDGCSLNVQELLRRQTKNIDIYQIDQERKWESDVIFDLCIYWGIIYHLKNWKEDLKRAIKYSNVITIESEVADIFDANYEKDNKELGIYDASIHGMGVITTAEAIEQILKEENLIYKRYDDEDLNCAFFKYDWKLGSRGCPENSRRFWVACKKDYNIFDK